DESLAVRFAKQVILSALVVVTITFESISHAIEVVPDPDAGKTCDVDQRDVLFLAVFFDRGLSVDADAHVISGERDVGGGRPELGARDARAVGYRPYDVPLVGVAFSVTVRADDHVVGCAVFDGLGALVIEQRNG